VSDGHCAAAYAYLAGSDLVETIPCTTDETDPRLAITRAYDTEDRLASILAEKPGTTPLTLARWDYTLDDDGRRTRTPPGHAARGRTRATFCISRASPSDSLL